MTPRYSKVRRDAPWGRLTQWPAALGKGPASVTRRPFSRGWLDGDSRIGTGTTAKRWPANPSLRRFYLIA